MSTLRTSSCLITAAVGLALAVPPATPVALAASSGHDVAVHGMIVRGSHAARPSRSGSKLLASRGGAVQVSPKVYIVFWGWTDSTTTTNGFTYPSDPGQVAALQVAFFQHVGVAGSDDWSSSTTQYCSGVASGTTNCLAASGTVTYPAQSGSVLAGTWVDGASVPASPTQSQIAAVAAAGQSHFGVNGRDVQIVVDTPTGHSMSGFKTSWCAWHSSTNSGTLSYTYMPYMPDAGANCGANFLTQGSPQAPETGANEGVTVVGGHEFAESVSDPFPSTGWLDSSGSENGDKCAWASNSAFIGIGGETFAVQPLWSNNDNAGAGGCVTHYVGSAGSVSSQS